MPARSFAVAALVAAVLIRASDAHADDAAPPPEPLHVLFIGNSYTAFNDMPTTMAAMGRSLGREIAVETRTVGGATLEMHRLDPSTLDAIASRPWDVVVLQNHSLASALPPAELRQRSLPDVRFFARIIRENHPATRIILYETWGRRDGIDKLCPTYAAFCSFERHAAAVRRGYALYARAINAGIAPVGTNWRRVVRDRPASRPFAARALWLNDGSHPSRLGSYLAAATILRTIIGKPVSAARVDPGLPEAAAAYLGGPLSDPRYDAGLPAEAAAYLRQIVDRD